MSEESFDLVILGGGPGGYVAAIRAAQLGLRVAVIDEFEKFGGTCLRVGCIPSKALLESSHRYEEAARHLGEHGIHVGALQLDLPQMMARKNAIVDTLTSGINRLLKRNKVAAIVGRGRFVGAGELEVQSGDAARRVRGARILIATGSLPAAIPNVPFDGERIGDSTGRARLRLGPAAAGRHRRRGHRLGTRFGLEPARQPRHRPRSDRADLTGARR